MERFEVSFKGILSAAEKFVGDNASGILTGLGVAGAVTTAVLTGRATWSAAEIVNQNNLQDDVHDLYMPMKKKIDLVWKQYIPPAVVGAVTITAIIAANRVGSRRAAAIAAAFRISENMSEEYKKRVVEALGKKSEEKVRADVMRDQMERIPGNNLIIAAGSEVIFFDQFSGRYFPSDIETVRQVVNKINQQVNHNYYASLTDFYEALGLPKTEMSDEFGWNSDELLEVTFIPVLMEGTERPAIGISFNKFPIRGYSRVH
jgi:hypothetical protein